MPDGNVPPSPDPIEGCCVVGRRARKEWAELRKRQEDTQQTLDWVSRTVLGRPLTNLSL